MLFYKLEDFNKDYLDAAGSDEIIGLDVYAGKDNKKVGAIRNILVDEAGRFHYARY